MFIVFKLRYGNLQNSFEIYYRKLSLKKLHICYIECMFCFQSLQYNSIYILLSLFEELGGVVGH